MAKRMKIVFVSREGKPLELTNTHKRTFYSYARVAKALCTGDAATVQVESKCGEHWICDGFGIVERTGLQSYTVPRRLMHEY